MLTVNDINLNNKRVLVRVDLNVPIKNGVIENDSKLRAILPTLNICLKAQTAYILLLSHLGRPTEGVFTQDCSLKPIARRLSELLHHPVRFVQDWLNGVKFTPGDILLGENVRFNPGEKANNADLAKQMAALCDVFVMDAFATAHRSEASTVGITKFAPISVAGSLLTAELKALSIALHSPKPPVIAIVGGSKVSDKLALLKNLLPKVDTLIVGGGIANTFLAALGYSIGSSLCEVSLIPMAKDLLALAKTLDARIVVPKEVVVAKAISDPASKRTTDLSDIATAEKILDIGQAACDEYKDIIQHAKTIIWNGPVGVFEREAFEEGTKQLAQAIADSAAYSLAGGGETLAAIEKYQAAEDISYISTGGGAFLEYLEGKTLPAVAALEAQKR